MNQEVNVLAIVKGKERYVFMYNEKNREQTIEAFARYASDSELSFSWYDAAVLTQRVRKEQRQAEIAAARAAVVESKSEVRRAKPSVEVRKSAARKVMSDLFGELDD